MRLNSIDIKSTFLQRKAIDRDIFIVSPLEAGTEKPDYRLYFGITTIRKQSYSSPILMTLFGLEVKD